MSSRKTDRRRRPRPAGSRAGHPAVRGQAAPVPPESPGPPGAEAAIWHARGPLLTTALVVTVLLLAVSFAGYYAGLFSPHIIVRQAALLPLALALATVCALVVAPGARRFAVDLIDVLVVAAGVWTIIGAALSPAPWVAWLGYYNRGTGTAFVLALLVLLLAARRLLVSSTAVQAITWTVSVLLLLLAGVAAVQAAGGTAYWTVAGLWPGRWTGTTGNPLTMAGLSLIGVWLLAWLVADRAARPRGPEPKKAKSRPPRAARATRWAAAVGVCAALAANLLAVTRASYIAWAVALLLIAAWLVRRRRHRELFAILVLLGVVAACAFVPVPNGRGGTLTLFTRVETTSSSPSGALGSSDRSRLDMWRTATRAISSRPLLGYGAGAYVAADRLYRPTGTRNKAPESFTSDPHSLPLLVASQTGVVGLLLFTVLAALVGVALFRFAAALPRRAADAGAVASSRGAQTPDAPGDPVIARGCVGLATLAYLAATALFLLVGPLDIAVAVPMALLAGMAVPLDWTARLRMWNVPALTRPAAARTIAVAAPCLLGALTATTLVLGVQLLRADHELAAYASGGAAAEARRAHSLYPWEPFYALEAGAATWREAAKADKDGSVGENAGTRSGEAMVRAGIGLDPTGPIGYADLARFDIATGRFDEVAADLLPGLQANPHHPVLEGLWAYASDAALTRSDVATAQSLYASLSERLPASPDAWHWVSLYLDTAGEHAAAASAAQKASALAPGLTDADYQQRLLRGR